MKNLIFASALFFLLIGVNMLGQEKKEQNKEKKMVIKIEKEEDGKTTKIDTTIILKEGDDPSKILEQYGVKHDEDNNQTQTFTFKFDDSDTSQVKKSKKMVWVSASNDDTIKLPGKHKKVVVITGDDCGNILHSEDANVMIWKEKNGNQLYHIEEIEDLPGSDSMIFKTKVYIDEDMDMQHKKVMHFRGEPGKDKDVIIMHDFQGPGFAPMMHDDTDSTVVIVRSYKDGKAVTENINVVRNERKEKNVMLKITDPEKEDLVKLKLKENYKKLEGKDFAINVNNEKMKLSFELPVKASTTITIIDANGKAYLTENLKDFQGKFAKDLEVIQGVFYVQINQGTKYLVKKVELTVK